MPHPISRFTHPLCNECWEKRHGIRTPTRLVILQRVDETCCCCGTTTKSGIYVRAVPSDLAFCAANDCAVKD